MSVTICRRLHSMAFDSTQNKWNSIDNEKSVKHPSLENFGYPGHRSLSNNLTKSKSKETKDI